MKQRTVYIDDYKLKHGYCRICGNHDELSRDHVPPKSLRSIKLSTSKSMYCSLFEGNIHRGNIKRKNGNSGIYFKTICRDCNNTLLGGMDNIYKGVKTQIISMYRYLSNGNHFLQKQEVLCDTTKFMRATMGHFLAIGLQSSCLEPLEDSPYFSAMRDFVLGSSAIPEGIEVRITPFRNRKAILSQTIASTGTMRSIGNGGDIYSSIRMFPFGITMYLRGSEDKPPALIKLGDILTPGLDSFMFTPGLEVPPGYPEQIFRNDQIILAGDETGLNGQFL